MGNTVVARLHVNGGHRSWDTLLPEKITYESSIKHHVNCFIVLPAAVTFQRDLILCFHLVHHALSKHEPVK
jgi:hypothetical protein